MGRLRATAVILAAGQGTRARTETPKQLVKVAGKSLVGHAAAAFTSHPGIESVVVIHPPGMAAAFEHLGVRLVEGGCSRNESTCRALAAVDTPFVVIHDGVRPLVTRSTIDAVLGALADGAVAVDTVIPSTDTLIVQDGGTIVDFPDRNLIWRGQTPQGFRTTVLRDAYDQCDSDYSDDCQVVAAAGYPVTVVPGDETNIKVTHPGDFAVADRLFQLRRSAPTGEPFTGRALVVGGSSGIGAALVELTGASTVSQSTGFDVLDPDPTVFEGFDTVVVTAGVLDRGPLVEQDPATVADMLAVNLGGAINVARAAHKHLSAVGGHLVLCGSSSYTRGRAGLAVYSATKAAIVALTQALAEEWPDVRVNCVCPERTDTPMRRTAFPGESPDTLMSASDAAAQIAAMLGTPLTGQIFDIRRTA